MALSKINFSLENLQNYYSNEFTEDINNYFVRERHYGISYITPDRRKYTSYFKDQEKELMFIGILSCFFDSQCHLFYTFSDLKKLSDFFMGMQMPLIYEATPGNFIGLKRFLSSAYLEYYLTKPEESLKYIEMLDLVFPFVTKLISSKLRELDKTELHDERAVEHFEHKMDETLFVMKRNLMPQTGMMGIHFTRSAFQKYFENSFKEQFYRYFPVEDHQKDFPQVLYMDCQHKNRVIDGKPGKTIEENIMFSVAMLYLIFAEQSVELFSPEAQEPFHQAGRWPLISCGMAGYKNHALMMLEEAGLTPSCSESLFYIEAIEAAETYMTEKFDIIINNKCQTVLAHDELEQAMANHNRKLVKKQMRKFIMHTKFLLKARLETPNLSWGELISKYYGGYGIQKFSIKK